MVLHHLLSHAGFIGGGGEATSAWNCITSVQRSPPPPLLPLTYTLHIITLYDTILAWDSREVRVQSLFKLLAQISFWADKIVEHSIISQSVLMTGYRENNKIYTPTMKYDERL